MKKVEFSQFGEPLNVLQLADEDQPKAGTGEVRVHVEAAPINPADLLTIQGVYGQLPQLPATPGSEGVGRIVETGPGVDNVAVDNLVLLPPGSGTWRTQMVIPAQGLFALPDAVDPLQLAMLRVNPMTALVMLEDMAALNEGDWVMLNAANAAVGHYLVSLARLKGIKTVGLVRRDGGVVRSLKELGATEVVVDQGQDIPAEVASLTGGSPIRLGIDAVGGPATQALAECLADSGTIVNYGALSGQACELAPPHLIFRGIRLRGFWVSRWLREADPQHVRQRYDQLIELMEKGQLRAEVEGTYPLDHFQDAVKAAASGGRSGKILLTPDAPSW